MKNRNRRISSTWLRPTLLAVVVLATTSLRAATVKVSGYLLLQYQLDHSGALVEFFPGPSPASYSSALTDTNGYFEATVQSPGGYTIAFSKAGYEPVPGVTVFLYKDTTFASYSLTKYWTQLLPGYQQTRHFRRQESPYGFGPSSGQTDLTCDSLFIEAGCRIDIWEGIFPQVSGRLVASKYVQAVGLPNDTIHLTGQVWIDGASGSLSYTRGPKLIRTANQSALDSIALQSCVFSYIMCDTSVFVDANHCSLDVLNSVPQQFSATPRIRGRMRNSVLDFNANLITDARWEHCVLSGMVSLESGGILDDCDGELVHEYRTHYRQPIGHPRRRFTESVGRPNRQLHNDNPRWSRSVERFDSQCDRREQQMVWLEQ